jgi:hypothetical protein
MRRSVARAPVTAITHPRHVPSARDLPTEHKYRSCVLQNRGGYHVFAIHQQVYTVITCTL